MTLRRAYSLLTVKSVDDEQRVITGIASTPTVDRMGDVVDPMGARFKTPMPLLLYHDSQRPVGTVNFAKPTKDGIPFTASLPNVTEPGTIQDRVNEAWHSIKYKLIAAVSIGFQPSEDGYELMKTGGLKFTEWSWLELSLCAIPANPDAVIQSFKSMDALRIRESLGESQDQSIKSFDTKQIAAYGHSLRGGVRLVANPGASGAQTAALRGFVKLIPRNKT